MVESKILESIERLALDLRGKVVLTEAATGPYAVTAVIAALAGAEVVAFTKSSKYGSTEDVKREVLGLAERLNLHESRINIIDELTPKIINAADVITNSGHLRPLNKEFLKYAKLGTVIPLMYEAWEQRDEDLDLTYCNGRITVGATNERHPDIDVFNYLGDMALKMIFEAGLCLYKNKFVLICNNDFGPFIAKVLRKNCDRLAVCDSEQRRKKYDGLTIDWAGNFPHLDLSADYKDAEAVLFTAYPFDKSWIGYDTEISIARLKEQILSPYILRFAGDVDENALVDAGIKSYPTHVRSGHMGILCSAIGYDPIIRLQSGGLKAAELMMKKEIYYRNDILVDMMVH